MKQVYCQRVCNWQNKKLTVIIVLMREKKDSAVKVEFVLLLVIQMS